MYISKIATLCSLSDRNESTLIHNKTSQIIILRGNFIREANATLDFMDAEKLIDKIGSFNAPQMDLLSAMNKILLLMLLK